MEGLPLGGKRRPMWETLGSFPSCLCWVCRPIDVSERVPMREAGPKLRRSCLRLPAPAPGSPGGWAGAGKKGAADELCLWWAQLQIQLLPDLDTMSWWPFQSWKIVYGTMWFHIKREAVWYCNTNHWIVPIDYFLLCFFHTDSNTTLENSFFVVIFPVHWHVKRVTESDGGVCCRQGDKDLATLTSLLPCARRNLEVVQWRSWRKVPTASTSH